MLNIFVPLNHSKLPKILTLVGLLVLVAIAFLTFWSARDFVSAARWRRHSYSVRYEARAFTASLESLKSSLFSMAIQPRIVTIEQFNSSKQDLQRNLSSLRDLVADNATQAEKVQKISQLISEKTPIWEKLSHELIRGESLKNRADFHYLLNQTTTVNVDAQIAALEAEEDLLLMQRGTKAERLFELTSAVVISGIIVAFLLFFFSNNLLQKEILRREETEKELQRAKQKSIEASELKSSFLANMSHEIRTPLNGIIGMSKLLEHTPLNARQVDYVETIKTSSNSLLALINDILDFSKIESGKFQLEETNFELKSLLKSAVSIVDYSAKSKGLEIITDIENTVPEFLVGDPLRLRQVLLNLLNNAIKFSDTGTIKLLVQKLATTDDSQAKLLFEVIDQGVGFDAETRQKLFQSFSQGDNSMSRRYGGTGLGLAISKQIVELMSGGIDVESTKGVGSKFFFNVLLKVPKKDSTIQSISKMHTIPPLHGYILVAEDNRVNQKVVSEMLSLMGCTCHIVENGKEAIEALKREDFDLILMDAQMPVMDGYEATRLIRRGDAGSANKIIPILATTANAIKGDIEACLEAGMNDYISKPIAYNDLAIKIEKWMARGQNVIDDTNLQKLREQGEKSGKEFISELVEIFKQDAPEAVAVMRSNLNAKLIKEIPPIAHNLKTSAGILGALRLKELAERIERSKMDSVTEQQLALLIDSLDNELRLVLEHLDNQLKKDAPRRSSPDAQL